jgi:spore coat protein CotH
MKFEMKIFKYALYVAVIFFNISCTEIDNDTPSEVFGLPHVTIEMRESDFAGLLKDALVSEYAAITIERNGVKEYGKIRRRGNISRYFSKPSFHIKTNGGEWQYVASNIDKSYCKEVFANIIFEKTGNFFVPKTEFVALSINNIYQGLYISREPIDEKFFQRRNIGINALYKVNFGGKFTFKDGHNSAMDFRKLIPQSSLNYDDLNILISALDKNDSEKIKNVSNIDNVAKYSFISSVINNGDGITNNLHIYNTKNDARFYIIPCDMDMTFDGNEFLKFENGLLERAEDIYLSEYGLKREQCIDSTSRYIGSLVGVLDSLKNKISQAYENDPYLQGENLDWHISQIKRRISR